MGSLTHRPPARPHRLRPARARGEDGAAIIIVLAFMLVVMVVLFSVLQMAYSSTKSQRIYHQDRVLRYNADAALEWAINTIAQQPTLAVSSTSSSNCFDTTRPVVEYGTKYLADNSVLFVTCGATTVTSVPAGEPQAARFVTITVKCLTGQSMGSQSNKLACGPSNQGANRTLAVAKVRYDINYSITDNTKWAVVPKILSYDILR